MLKITKFSTIIVIFYILFYVETWGDNHALLYGASLIVVFSMMIHWFGENEIKLSCVPFGIWNNCILVVYSLTIGIFVAADYSMLLDSCITFASFSVICIAICYVSVSENNFEWVLDTLIILAVICMAYMLINGTVWKGYGRTLSKYNNPHAFAAVMNLGIFSTAFKCKKHDIKEFVISSLLIYFFIYGVIECGSRKYLIADVFFVAFWNITSIIYIWKDRNTNNTVLLVIIIGAIILLVKYYYTNIYITSLSHSRMLDNSDHGNAGRLIMYQRALDIFWEKPLFGGGYDQYRFWSGVGGYAHSTYAEAIADFGLVGSALYFAPIGYSVFHVWKRVTKKGRSYQSVMLLIFCIAELFIGTLQIFFMEFYHFIAWTLIFYLEQQTSEDVDDKKLIERYKYIRK